MVRDYPIVIYEVPNLEETEELWHNDGLTALAQTIIASIRNDIRDNGLSFPDTGDIIEVPVRVEEEGQDGG